MELARQGRPFGRAVPKVARDEKGRMLTVTYVILMQTIVIIRLNMLTHAYCIEVMNSVTN